MKKPALGGAGGKLGNLPHACGYGRKIAAMNEPKIDLKDGHIGGRPKDWLDRASEPSPLGMKEYALIAGLLACLAVVAYGLIQLALWLFGR